MHRRNDNWSSPVWYRLLLAYAVVALLLLLVLLILPSSMLSALGFGFLDDAAFGGRITLAVIGIAILVPLGFHLAFDRRLKRDSDNATALRRIRDDILSQYASRNPDSRSQRKSRTGTR